MSVLDRRAVMLGIPVLLISCKANTATLSADITSALNIGAIIDSGLIKIIGDSNTAAPTIVSTSAANTAIGWLNLAGTGIADLLGMKLPPPGASTLDQIDVYFQDAMDLVTPVIKALPSGSLIIAAIDAVETLLPFFEKVIPTLTAAIVRQQRRLTSRARPRITMTQDQAVATLKLYLSR